MAESLSFHFLHFPKSPRLENETCYFLAGRGRSLYPLSGVVEHFLPGGVELAAVLLQQPLLGQGDGLLRCPQDLHRALELLRGLLGLDLSLRDQKHSKGQSRVMKTDARK